MRHECPSPSPDCKYFDTDNCLMSVHHLYWPRKDYTTPTEKRFRDLPQHKELLPRCEHDLRHLAAAPEKPDLQFMLQALERSLNEQAS